MINQILARIIPKTREKKQAYLIFSILCVAALLRLFRISDLTEFLGDQGRTGVVIYDAFQSRSIPLAGPTVLTGQHLGPIFYYLIGLPFLFSGFYPLGPAIFMALVGVLTTYLLYWVGSKIFRPEIGVSISLLYAVSPQIVAADRTIWEPNLIPFFAVLYLVLLYKIYTKPLLWSWFCLGITVGVLIQLHYPNIFFLFLTSLFWIILVKNKKSTVSYVQFFLYGVFGIAGLFFCLFPFLYYESQHAFTDLREIVLIFLGFGNTYQTHVPFFSAFADLASRAMTRVVPFNGTLILAAIGFFMIVVMITMRSFWILFLFFWFLVGVASMSLYKGTVYDHYLSFLFPLAFLIMGAVLELVWVKKLHKVAVIAVVVIAFVQLTKTDIFLPGTGDIERTEKATSLMIQLSKGEPFSFTLISSRSFSDLHYRYFFLLKHASPLPIGELNYPRLFLVCDQLPCSSDSEVRDLKAVQALCFDFHCEGEYPTIDLRHFQFLEGEDMMGGRIYSFERKI